MNKKEIFKKVAGIIAELNEQYEYLSQDPENLNELELELFAANADFLSDHITILQKLNHNSKSHNPKPEHSAAVDTSTPESLKPVENLINEEETEKIIPEWKFEIKEEVSEPVFNSEFKIFEESARKEPVNSSTAEDQPLTINEILAAQASQNTVSGQFVQRQVKDLKSLINLNDKLLFVRDLFNGYSLAYSEAIEILNRFESFEAADNFLKQNYSSKNNWAEKQNVADKFYEILNNRFSR